MGVHPSQVHVVPNPVDGRRVQRLARGGTDQYSDQPRPRLVALGRLEHVKGFDLLLAAWAIVYAERGGHLVIFGEGSQADALRAQSRHLELEDAVTFAGFHDNPWPTVAASDGLVVSSRDEGFGLTLVEAMALGVPVATTCGDGAPGEIVDRGLFGHVAATDDVESLADAMRSLIDRPHAPALLIERARRWSPDRAFAAWAELLDLT
jgi:glycosyltransferase involved in cell wall biosynthesis